MENKLSYQMNVFAPTEVIKGQRVLPANTESFSGIVDSSQATALQPATPVKIVASSAALPHFAAAAAGDLVVGFVEWNIIRPEYDAGKICQVSPAGNVMYMEASAPIDAGVNVAMADLDAVTIKAAGEGDSVIGFAMESATEAGQLIRVKIGEPAALAIA